MGSEQAVHAPCLCPLDHLEPDSGCTTPTLLMIAARTAQCDDLVGLKVFNL